MAMIFNYVFCSFKQIYGCFIAVRSFKLFSKWIKDIRFKKTDNDF